MKIVNEAEALKVTYVDHMGSDMSIVDAARVSFHKKSKWVETCSCGIVRDADGNWPGCGSDQRDCINQRKTRTLSDGDKKLINFLAKARPMHFSPFTHTTLSVRCKAPLAIAGQLKKHQVGLSWNEVSRRYVDDPPEFFIPTKWRKRAKDKKQGSHVDQFVDYLMPKRKAPDGHSIGVIPVNDEVKKWIKTSAILYDDMIAEGVAPEQARFVLPQGVCTEWIWTGSLLAFVRIANLRHKTDAQWEAQYFAHQLLPILNRLWPVASEALLEIDPFIDYTEEAPL